MSGGHVTITCSEQVHPQPLVLARIEFTEPDDPNWVGRRPEGRAWWIAATESQGLQVSPAEPWRELPPGSEVEFRRRHQWRCDCGLDVTVTNDVALAILNRFADVGVSNIELARLAGVVSNWR